MTSQQPHPISNAKKIFLENYGCLTPPPTQQAPPPPQGASVEVEVGVDSVAGVVDSEGHVMRGYTERAGTS